MTNTALIRPLRNEAFVAYSLPGTTDFISCSVAKYKSKSEGDDILDYDFIFAPFDSQDHPSFLLNFNATLLNGAFEIPPLEAGEETETSKNYYNANCTDAINRLRSKELEKVILSKIKIAGTPPLNEDKKEGQESSGVSNFFVYLVYTPEVGCWMGASPELLLSKQNAQYKTVALAGTQKLDKALADIAWKAKDIKEHNIVIDYIESTLKNKDIHFVKSESYTSAAGNVCHIKTDFLFPPSLKIDKALEAIHPSPALSGMPVEDAVKLIKILEQHDREYYCGYLGPIHSDHTFDLYINLRCMKVNDKYFKLYVGGGLTEDSEVEKEWQETELKAMTLLSVLENDVPNDQ